MTQLNMNIKVKWTKEKVKSFQHPIKTLKMHWYM